MHLHINNDKGVVLKTICDFGQEKLNYMKTKFPDSVLYTDEQSIFEDRDIDILSIASYDNYHSKLIVKAFENGEHVMVEKLLCLRLDELIELYPLHEKMPC